MSRTISDVRRFVLVLAAITGGLGCSFEPRLPEGSPCGLEQQCPRGMTCRSGVCCATAACGQPDAGGDVLFDAAVDHPPADAATAPPAAEIVCDPGSDEGCDAGKRCRILGCAERGWATSCTDGQGKREGEICRGASECAPGLTCMTAGCPGLAAVGLCARICKRDADCGATGACTELPCGEPAMVTGVCLPRCDPMRPTEGCVSGLVCRLAEGDTAVCACHQAGSDGTACGSSYFDCGTGHVCAYVEAAPKCRPICRVGENDCPQGRSCLPLPNHRRYGACVPDGSFTPLACEPAVASSCGPGAGCSYSCSPADRFELTCQPRAPRSEGGLTCTGSQDCAAGSTCVAEPCDGGNKPTVCRKHCKVDEDCGGGTARCIRNVTPCGPLKIVPYGVCAFACDPRGAATGGCPEGTRCWLVPLERTDCSCPQGFPSGGDGEPCAATNFFHGAIDCPVGMTCVDERGKRTCRPICRLDEPTTCSPGRTCTALLDQRSYGACLPAAP